MRIVSERLEKAEEAAGALIYDWDIVAQKIWRSAGLTRVLGWQIDEVAPTVEGWAALLHPADKDRLKALQNPELLKADDNYVMEYRLAAQAWLLCLGAGFRPRVS